jgi:hypothetical protein
MARNEKARQKPLQRQSAKRNQEKHLLQHGGGDASEQRDGC